jgi:hypothetical protein
MSGTHLVRLVVEARVGAVHVVEHVRLEQRVVEAAVEGAPLGVGAALDPYLAEPLVPGRAGLARHLLQVLVADLGPEVVPGALDAHVRQTHAHLHRLGGVELQVGAGAGAVDHHVVVGHDMTRHLAPGRVRDGPRAGPHLVVLPRAEAGHRPVEGGVEVHLVAGRRAAEAAGQHPSLDRVAVDAGLAVVHAVDRAAGVQQQRGRLARGEGEAADARPRAHRQLGLDARVQGDAVEAGPGPLVGVLELLDVVHAVRGGGAADPAGERHHREVLGARAARPGDVGHGEAAQPVVLVAVAATGVLHRVRAPLHHAERQHRAREVHAAASAVAEVGRGLLRAEEDVHERGGILDRGGVRGGDGAPGEHRRGQQRGDDG